MQDHADVLDQIALFRVDAVEARAVEGKAVLQVEGEARDLAHAAVYARLDIINVLVEVEGHLALPCADPGVRH